MRDTHFSHHGPSLVGSPQTPSFNRRVPRGRALLTLLAMLLSVGPVLSGCQPSVLPWKWAGEDMTTLPDDDRFPDAPAEVLLRRQRALLNTDDDWYTQIQHQEVIVIKSEDGLSYATKHFVLPDGAELIHFEARTINPDGEIYYLTQKDLLRGGVSLDKFNAEIISFRHPKVQVGSVIESIYTIQYEWLTNSLQQTMSSRIPVREYRLDLRGSTALKYALHTYNVPKRAQKADLGNKWRLTLAVSNIPAHECVDAKPDWTLGQMHWYYRTKYLKFSERRKSKYRRTWTGATKHRVRTLYDNEDFLGEYA